jgi:hypothetical protein
MNETAKTTCYLTAAEKRALTEKGFPAPPFLFSSSLSLRSLRPSRLCGSQIAALATSSRPLPEKPWELIAPPGVSLESKTRVLANSVSPDTVIGRPGRFRRRWDRFATSSPRDRLPEKPLELIAPPRVSLEARTVFKENRYGQTPDFAISPKLPPTLPDRARTHILADSRVGGCSAAANNGTPARAWSSTTFFQPAQSGHA